MAVPLRQVQSPEKKRAFVVAVTVLLTLALFEVMPILSAQEAVSTPVDATMVSAARPGEHSEARRSGSDVVSYWYGPWYRTPFVVSPNSFKGADIQRSAIDFTHVGYWSMGTTMADVMLNQSAAVEPSSQGGSGATEIYATLRSDIGLNQVTHANTFHRGPLRNVSLELGANLETKNSSYAPSERTIYFGPKFQFALPRGYFNVGLHLRKEWNHEGVLGKSESYDPDFNIEPAWALPFAVGKLHLAYIGFADLNSSKGNDSFGTRTAPEFLVRNYVAADIGELLLHRRGLLDLNGGFWYWLNEYGKPSSLPGAKQLTPIMGVALHLDGIRSGRGE